MKMRTAICMAIIGLALILPASAKAATLITDSDGHVWCSSPPDYIWYLYDPATKKTLHDKGYEKPDIKSRLVFEHLADGRLRFYAWIGGGCSKLVGGGHLRLLSGNSYTVSPEQIEVRNISTDQLLGYALPLKSSEKDKSPYFEMPDAFVDNNRDGLVTIAELHASLVRLEQEAAAAKLTPSTTARLSANDKSTKALINQGLIAQAYKQVVEMRTMLASDVEVAKKKAIDREQAENKRDFLLVIGIGAAALVLLCAGAFMLVAASIALIRWNRNRKTKRTAIDIQKSRQT